MVGLDWWMVVFGSWSWLVVGLRWVDGWSWLVVGLACCLVAVGLGLG